MSTPTATVAPAHGKLHLGWASGRLSSSPVAEAQLFGVNVVSAILEEGMPPSIGYGLKAPVTPY